MISGLCKMRGIIDGGCVLHGLQVAYLMTTGVLPLAKTSFNSQAENADKLQNKK